MSSSAQNPQVKEPFCLGAFDAVVESPQVVIDEASSSRIDDLVDAADDWGLRPRSLAVRAETLEMMLPVTDEVSEEKVRILAASNMLAASSDLTDERVLDVMADAPSWSREVEG